MIILLVLIWLKFFKILMEDIILLHRELLLYSKIALIFKLTNLNIGFNFIKEGRFQDFQRETIGKYCYGLNFFPFCQEKTHIFVFFFFLFGEKPSSSLLSFFLCEFPLIITQNTSLVTLPVTKCAWIFPITTSKSTIATMGPNSILIPSAGSQ